MHPAARREFAAHGHPLRFAGARCVVEDAVHRVLIKYPHVPVFEDVVLQRLQFQALFVGQILNGDRPEVGQMSARANGSVFGNRDGDLVDIGSARFQFPAD